MNLVGQSFPYAPGTIPDCMKYVANAIPLHTGMNWQANPVAPYWGNEHDRYWRLTGGEGGVYPRCATVWHWWQPTNWLQESCANGITRAISSDVSGSVVGNNNQTFTCNTINPYYFQRRFFVDIPTGTTVAGVLHLDADVDDGIKDIIFNAVTLSGVNVNCINYNVGLGCDWAFSWSWPVTLVSGINTLEIPVVNRSFGGNADSSTMALNVRAWVSSPDTTPIFVRNDYYIPNTEPAPNGCASLDPLLYPPIPTTQNQCLLSPGTVGQIDITNYNPAFTYSIAPSTTISATGSIVATSGTTYTITASNANNCGVTATALLEASPPLTVSLSTNSLCVATPLIASVPVSITATGGTPYYSYSSSPSGGIIASTLYINNAGTYVVTATDANNCTATTTLEVGNIFDVQLSMLTPCVGQSIVANVTPALPNINYSLNGGPPQTSNSFLISTSGVYTVTASDPWGCTSSSIIEVYDKPDLTLTSNGLDCYPTFNVSINSGAPIVMAGWADPYNAISHSPSPFSWIFTPPAQLTPLPPTIIYTVTVHDANTCTNTLTLTYHPNPFCCQNQVQQIPADPQAYFSSHQLYANGTASDMIAAYSSNVITNSGLIAFDGDIMIDQDITFVNCPQLRCTYNTKWIVQPGVTLTFLDCDMRAYCDGMWKGIYASDPSMLLASSQSTFADMQEGIVMDQGARIHCTDSHFEDNYYCIQLTNAPLGYNAVNANCILFNNTFTSSGNSLLYPYQSQNKSESGIRVKWCREIQIGDLQQGSGNHFSGLYNGVHILAGPYSQTEKYYLYGNTFDDIRIHPIANLSHMYYRTLQWAVPNHRGVGVYVYPTSMVGVANTHHLYIESSSEAVNFNLCDKAVLTHATGASISWQMVARCLMGFMFASAQHQYYSIRDNGLTGNSPLTQEAMLVGMRFVGNTENSLIDDNEIDMGGLVGMGGSGTLYPIGIDVQHFTIDHNKGIVISNNTISLQNASGAGILLRNTSAQTDLYKNRIFNYSNGLNGNSNYLSAGIALENCNRTKVRGNLSTGNVNLLTAANSYDAIRLNASPDCLLECNRTIDTRRGLRVYSNCATAMDRVRGNSFEQHGYAMEFNDLGTQGTLGDIGTPSYDCRNQFTNAALFSAGVYGIYRNVILPVPSPNIYTTYCPSTYSCSNLPLCLYRYDIVPNPGVANYICPQTIYPPQLMMGQGASPSLSIQQALDIALDSVVYNEYTETVSWMEKQRVFNALSGPDSILLSNTELAQFYSNQQLHYSDELYEVNRQMNLLHDSTLYLDSMQYISLLYQIEMLNNSIGGTNSLELNEKMINSYILQRLQGALDSLSASDSTWIAQLAYSCPFVNGYGVYKARALYSQYYALEQYTDKNLCNAAGMYKNANQQDEEPELKLQETSTRRDLISIYPNPFIDEVNIAYHLATEQDASLVLYDVLGKEIYRKVLPANQYFQRINLKSIASGFYVYRISTASGELYIGKLQKQ